MKTLFLSITMCLTLGLFTVSAQNSGHKGKARTEKNELNLSAEQKEQMKNLREDFSKQMSELKKNETLSKEERRSKGKELRQAHHDKVNQILTSEQQQNIAKLRKNNENRDNCQAVGKHKRNHKKHIAHVRKHKANRKHSNPMLNLNLSDAQKAQIKELKKTHIARSHELKAQQRAEVLNILTPEQQAQLKQNKIERFAKRNKITTEGAEKIQALRENFKAEKSAVERSRIAPEAQQQKIKILSEKFAADRKKIIEQYKVKKQQAS